jgi:thioredoxin reductase
VASRRGTSSRACGWRGRAATRRQSRRLGAGHVYFANTQPPSPTETAELDARGIRVVHGEVARLVVENDRLTGVQLADGQVIPRAAIFVRPIIVPHPDNLLARLGCDLDDTGFAIVDSTGRTSIPGVWGAGNAVDPRAQVITAAGQGSAAAIAINADLVHDDIAVAIATQL